MSIRVSEKHGVNPSVQKCFFCQKDVGVVLFGRLPGDAEAPRSITLNHTPCDECKIVMAAGVVLISVDEAKSTDMKNPWRSGGWCAVTDSYIERVIPAGALRDDVLKKRVAFMPDETWDMLGLPRGSVDGVPSSIEELRAK